MSLFFLDLLSEILETAFLTAAIKNEVPVSLILIGPSGVAKSSILKQYRSDYIHTTDSITSQGLFDILVKDSKKTVRFILLPDFNPTLSRKPQTVQSTIANLLTVTADGTVRIDDGRDAKTCEHPPVGLITACTIDIYSQQSKKWFALGLRRRILPLFYNYTPATVANLQSFVMADRIHAAANNGRVPLAIPKPARPAIPDSIGHQLKTQSEVFSVCLGKLSAFDRKGSKLWHVREVTPVSPHITLRTLARAHAVRDRRGAVNQSDVDFISRFLTFCDPEKPCLL